MVDFGDEGDAAKVLGHDDDSGTEKPQELPFAAYAGKFF